MLTPWPNDYIHSLWWLMHHSTDRRRSAVALAHYIDDSGISLKQPHAVIGGPVFLQRDFSSFHYEWDRILALHNVKGPIHMREFGRPHGRFAYLSDEQRCSLFHDLVYLINRRKAWSLTVEIDHLDFQQYFPQSKFKKLFGVAPLAFIWCMALNNSIVEENKEAVSKVSYVIAKSDFNTAILDCHEFIESYEKTTERNHTGSITFDNPANVNALQAADMIAWANRRKVAGLPFDSGFDALELLTRYIESDVKPGIHWHKKVNDESTRKLSEIVGNPVRGSNQRIPVLQPLPYKIPVASPEVEDGE
jgi:hypothetical protein